MSILKKIKGRAVAAKAAVVGGVAAASSSAMAQVDIAGVQTTLTDASAKAGTVGGAVIAVVAGLVIVGVIIALVRKV